MSLKLGLLAPGLIAAALPLAHVPVAAAEPVWPVAGAQSASATIDDLEAQGYDVQINWGERCQLGAAIAMQGHRDR
jgi:hypothetical protein